MSRSPTSETGGDRPVLVLFRDDLRLADNPALKAAAETGRPVACVFVLDEQSDGIRPLGGAVRWWLHHSLLSLAAGIARLGGRLVLARGPAADRVTAIAAATGAAAVHWNRRYGQAEQAADAVLKARLRAGGIEAASFNGHLMREPWEVTSQAGQPLKVFSPFFRAFVARGEVPRPLAAPKALRPFDWSQAAAADLVGIDDLGLLPVSPDWAGGLREAWTPGEEGALGRLDAFIDGGFNGYAENRNRPDIESTSRLSPHLRFGEISARQVWHAVTAAQLGGRSRASAKDLEVLQKELGWREFSYHLLGQFPELATKNFQSRFDEFPWQPDERMFKAWSRGKTGYPIIDAGMRQLWRTGWMHNRVRMIVASFLIKNLLIDWRQGEEWFWDTLVDADIANNAASWQWVAGSGADAAPYFRVFNPVLQGEKFDPDAVYVKRYLPELARLPAEHAHKPWLAPHPVRASAGITPGVTYPHPLVELDRSRDRALDAFKTLQARDAA
jgi:deoxyribodipyrimidine photo-lyase